MRTINNQDRISDLVNGLNLVGVESCGDDGSVCVQVNGNESRVREVSRILSENSRINRSRIGDGVQEGSLWINGVDCDLHGEVSDFVE